MPFKILQEPRGVHAVFSGRLTAEELLAATVKIHSDPHYDDVRYIIIDHTAVDEFSLDQAVMDEIKAHRIGAHFSNSRIHLAFVTTDQKLLAKITQENDGTTPYQTRVFSNLHDARHWCQTRR